MNNGIRITFTTALILAASAAHSAPINNHNVDVSLQSMSLIHTTPLTQTARGVVPAPNFDERDLLKIEIDDGIYADSANTIKGFWQNDS